MQGNRTSNTKCKICPVWQGFNSTRMRGRITYQWSLRACNTAQLTSSLFIVYFSCPPSLYLFYCHYSAPLYYFPSPCSLSCRKYLQNGFLRCTEATAQTVTVYMRSKKNTAPSWRVAHEPDQVTQSSCQETSFILKNQRVLNRFWWRKAILLNSQKPKANSCFLLNFCFVLVFFPCSISFSLSWH